LAEMIAIFEQLPSLEKVLFYTTARRSCTPSAALLRWLRQNRPQLAIHISTNALALTAARVREVVAERLVDRMLFAIDGARPTATPLPRRRQARQGARRDAPDGRRSQGRGRATLRDLWQYILFEWNDSDEELAEAREIAAGIGVPIEWWSPIRPGPRSASSRGARRWQSWSAASAPSGRSPVTEGRRDRALRGYEALRHAPISGANARLSGRPGDRVLLPVTVRHEGLAVWAVRRRLLPPRCAPARRRRQNLGELRGVQVPPGVLPGAELTSSSRSTCRRRSAPTPAARHDRGGCLLVSERGSTPAICALESSPSRSRTCARRPRLPALLALREPWTASTSAKPGQARFRRRGRGPPGPPAQPRHPADLGRARDAIPPRADCRSDPAAPASTSAGRRGRAASAGAPAAGGAHRRELRLQGGDLAAAAPAPRRDASSTPRGESGNETAGGTARSPASAGHDGREVAVEDSRVDEHTFEGGDEAEDRRVLLVLRIEVVNDVLEQQIEDRAP